MRLVATIVTYNNDPQQIVTTAQSFLDTVEEVELNIVDNNSPNQLLKKLAGKFKANFIQNSVNNGFGAAHNLGLHSSPASHYYLVLNPDVIIKQDALSTMLSYMDANPDIALLTPKTLNPDGTIQDHHRTVPSIFKLIVRRFLPKILSKKLFADNRFDANKIQELQVISGCFMLFRRDVIEKVNGFDEGFFMYFEDIDISLRAAQYGKVVYYPRAEIVHSWARGSHKTYKLTMIHIKSAFYFFYKVFLNKYKFPTK